MKVRDKIQVGDYTWSVFIKENNKAYIMLDKEASERRKIMKKYSPKRPINANGVCYTDKLCDIKKNCSECNKLNPNGTLEELKSGEKRSIGSWL